MDESSNAEGSRARIILTSLEGHDYTYEVCFEFPITNNITGYKVFLGGLGIIKALNAYPFYIHIDFN
jgi:hypothetical protein